MKDEQAILAVNAAYYRAFARADAEGIAQLWATDAVTCVHPGWRPLIGRAEVVKSYRDILANERPVPITCSDERVIVTGDFARVICTERVGRVLLAATNCFVRTDKGWLIAHHQASQVADAEPTRSARAEAAPRTLN